MHHELKIKDFYYQAIIEKRKTCELRYNDRDYQTKDTISFIGEGVNGAKYNFDGNWKVTHVLHYPEGLKDGWVILSLKKI